MSVKGEEKCPNCGGKNIHMTVFDEDWNSDDTYYMFFNNCECMECHTKMKITKTFLLQRIDVEKMGQ